MVLDGRMTDETQNIHWQSEAQLMGFGESDSSGAWIKLQVMPEDLDQFRGLKGVCFDVTLANPNQPTGQPVQKAVQQKEASQYGEYAKALKLSGFFRAPEVWKAIGTDAEFLEWLKTQKCCAKAKSGPCYGDIAAAHVRRVANGAGTSIKPEYSAVSLCDLHHKRQHAEGESVIGGREYFDQQRIWHLEKWCWETLKASLGFESWKDVPPSALRLWATYHKVINYLPNVYRESHE